MSICRFKVHHSKINRPLVLILWFSIFSIIHNRYRRLALKFHPSNNKEPGSAERFIQLGEAYDVLSDRKSEVKGNISATESNSVLRCLYCIWQLEKRQPMTSLARRALSGGSRLKLATLGHGPLNMSTTGNQKKHLCSFLEATIRLQVRKKIWFSTNYTDYSVCIWLPDFQICDVPPQASNLQPGVVKTQDPQIERDLHLSLEDLYLGGTKKIKISRRVGTELCDPSTRSAEERWRHAQKNTFIFFFNRLWMKMDLDPVSRTKFWQ